jgi:hypothetical protein
MPAPIHWIDALSPDDARLALVQALEMSSGDVARAAERLAVTRLGLWIRLRDLALLNLPLEMQSTEARRLSLG